MFYYSSSSLPELDSELDSELDPEVFFFVTVLAHATATAAPATLLSSVYSNSTSSEHGQAPGSCGKSDELNSKSRTRSHPFPSSSGIGGCKSSGGGIRMGGD